MNRRSFFAKLAGLVAIVPFLKESRMARNVRLRDEGLMWVSEPKFLLKKSSDTPHAILHVREPDTEPMRFRVVGGKSERVCPESESNLRE